MLLTGKAGASGGLRTLLFERFCPEIMVLASIWGCCSIQFLGITLALISSLSDCCLLVHASGMALARFWADLRLFGLHVAEVRKDCKECKRRT